MNYMMWLIRARRWVQDPPSPGRVRLVLAVIAVSLGIGLYDYMFGWPEWLTVNGRIRP